MGAVRCGYPHFVAVNKLFAMECNQSVTTIVPDVRHGQKFASFFILYGRHGQKFASFIVPDGRHG